MKVKDEIRPERDGDVRVWTVATETPIVYGLRGRKETRRMVEFIVGLDGYVGVHPDSLGRGVVWLFRTENDAKAARNLMEARGIRCGVNICEAFLPGEKGGDGNA